MWFLDQLLPDTALYNIHSALNLTGAFNLHVFEMACNALIQRHESLRTIFPTSKGKAQQVILPNLSISIAEHGAVNLSLLPHEEQQAAIKTLSAQEASTPFNLSSGPLIRLKIVQLNIHHHILFITMHHIISDGWSIDIFFKELSQFYNAYLQAQEPHLPELPIQYADFAIWQRDWLQGEVLEAQLAYWKQQLFGNCPYSDTSHR